MTSFMVLEGRPRAKRLPGCKQRTSNGSPKNIRLGPTLSTFEEERREALAGVLHSLATDTPDPDRTAACVHLLWHLTAMAARQ